MEPSREEADFGRIPELMNEPRRKQRGIVRSPVKLHSGFITLLTAPRGGVLNPSARIKDPDYAIVGARRNNKNFLIYAKKMADRPTTVSFLSRNLSSTVLRPRKFVILKQKLISVER